MAACESLQHIFETPSPDSPKDLLQSFSTWKHLPPLEVSSLTEVFGELHFEENKEPVSPSLPHSALSSPFSIDSNPRSEEKNEGNYTPPTRKHYKNSDSFSSMNSESLSICTEGLGFESCDNTEDFVDNSGCKHRKARSSITRHFSNEYLSGKRSRITGGEFPPPISCIGRTGKPWVCFKSYRQNGRFVLKEVKTPIQEFLHACRQDGRLKLRLIQSDDEITEEEEEDVSEGECQDEDENSRIHNFGEGEVSKGEKIVEDEGSVEV
ncbi:hypothetical protein DCAR_0311772 [Daucus carota subsp. sativus]|uniref:FAF domain-containing protein n=1 Tax=Daucus carota subsp. sativus TaxID=79200 RepID=A0A161WSE3_DAUCS|nr:PREDICTED: protein FAF-like, chloroplastic [Daucus carota subsp. sativus]WOG92503.1 hypothetical protein DCAR_0311772 [Daucus carota subsp. sativus]